MIIILLSGGSGERLLDGRINADSIAHAILKVSRTIHFN